MCVPTGDYAIRDCCYYGFVIYTESLQDISHVSPGVTRRLTAHFDPPLSASLAPAIRFILSEKAQTSGLSHFRSPRVRPIKRLIAST
ncbi:MAG: hypothetical protein QOH42_117 [Blastocatellia bacterium]|nr:hypothetical protein [Blastocatellia bacterium]